MIFSGSSKGTKTASNGIFKLTYIQFMFSTNAPCCVHKSFRTYVIIPQAYEVYLFILFSSFQS